MKTIFQEIDFHIFYLQIIFLTGAALLPHSPWVLIVLTAIPQGLILTRALIDYPAFKKPAAGYLIANETVVAASVVICLVLWQFIGKL